jgi:hypothetical protein
MDISKLVRNAEMIHAQLKELPDSRLVTIGGCKIYIPQRFSERNLAEVGVSTKIIGCFAITVQDKYYGVMSANAMMNIKPSSMNIVRIDETDYYEFVFDPGSTVIETTDLVKNNILVYRIYDEMISKGNIPWYLSYEDFGKIFDSAAYHADVNLGNNPEVIWTIISLIARDPKDRAAAYRTFIKSRKDLIDNPPKFIPLKSISASSNTTNKLAGSYFSVGVTSALVDPATRTEKIEEILRR